MSATWSLPDTGWQPAVTCQSLQDQLEGPKPRCHRTLKTQEPSPSASTTHITHSSWTYELTHGTAGVHRAPSWHLLHQDDQMCVSLCLPHPSFAHTGSKGPWALGSNVLRKEMQQTAQK